VYCTPADGFPLTPRSEFLSLEEIARLVRLVGRLGVGRIRLTGGEPLLRRDIVDIVRTLKKIDTVQELSITTNASRLSEVARPLRDAGLDRLNISFDALDRNRFRDIARRPEVEYDRVRRGVESALEAGFPVKLNMVVLRGLTEPEIFRFVSKAIGNDLEVRFLEFMPLCGDGWEAGLVYPIGEIREIVGQKFDLEPIPRGDRTAESYTIRGGRGRVGFIASLSEPFCENCSRMRLTADGKIRPCLFSDYEHPVGHLLKNGARDEEVLAAVRHAVANKPAGNQFLEKPFEKDDTSRDVTIGPFIRTVGG
jgi:cyclic pyranopterin phosphate synthase